jgi:hypothetical protein
MPKQPYKMDKHPVGLAQGAPPMEIVQQRQQLKEIMEPSVVPPPTPLEIVRDHQVRIAEKFRPIIKAKLACKVFDLDLEFPAYDVDIQERCINLQVPPEFSLSSAGEKIEFVLSINGSDYPVFFLGLTVHFAETNCHAIMFLKK